MEQGLEVKVVVVLDYYGSNDEYKDCDVGWILLSAMRYLPKENDNFRSFNLQPKSQSKNQRVCIAALKGSFISYSHRANISRNQKQNLLSMLLNYTSVEFTTLPSSSCES